MGARVEEDVVGVEIEDHQGKSKQMSQELMNHIVNGLKGKNHYSLKQTQMRIPKLSQLKK